MNDTTPQTSLRELLHNVSRGIDLDLAITIADILNVYTAAIQRNGGRTILIGDDAIRILHIINSILTACDNAPEPPLIKGTPNRVRPLPDSSQS